MEELLCLLTKLQEEVSRLRIIRESEMEIDYWSRSLPSLRQAQKAEWRHNMEDSLSFLNAAVHSNLMDKG